LQRIEEIAQGNLSENVDLVEVLQSTFESQKYQAAHRNQIFTLEAPAVALPIKGDSAQLREAVINIISNALKYTPDGGTVTVKLWEDNDIAFLDVVDTGYGIPEEQQERLFQPFYRPKTKETQQIDGTGLGLHLVKNIVERHHGKMHFVSEYGKGSTFGFSVPVYIGD
jgi:signal transduction histidine kinase